MADNAVQLSGKASNGLIYVVGGNTFDEFYVNMCAAFNGDTEKVDSILGKIAQLVDPLDNPAPPPPDTRGGQTGEARGGYGRGNSGGGNGRQATSPPGQQAPLCEHGEARVWRTGSSAKGPWKAWMCPRDRSESCEPQWVR